MCQGTGRAYHAAAVLAGNFATTLLAEAAGRIDRSRRLPHRGARPPRAARPSKSRQTRWIWALLQRLPDRWCAMTRQFSMHIEPYSQEVRPETLAMYEALVMATRRLASNNTQKNESQVD